MTFIQEKVEEKAYIEFKQLWDDGKFNWNENLKGEISPWRMWNVFIKPKITEALEEGKRMERETERGRAIIVMSQFVEEKGEEIE